MVSNKAAAEKTCSDEAFCRRQTKQRRKLDSLDTQGHKRSRICSTIGWTKSNACSRNGDGHGE